MKRLQIIGLTAVVLCLLALSSCKKDEPKSNGNNPTTSKTVQSGRVELDLSFGIENPDLRHMPITIQDNGIPSLDLDPSKLPNGLEVRSSIYIMRLNKSANGGGNPTQEYLTILKDVKLRVSRSGNERPRLVYKEFADIKGFVNKEDARNYDWYMCALVGGKWENDKQTYQPFGNDALSPHNPGDNGTIEVPYGFAWKKFDFENMGSFVEGANFSPMGYFFRFKIENATQANYKVNSLTFESESLFSHAYFDPTGNNLSRGDFEHSRARWANASTSNIWTITPPNGNILDINANTTTSGYYYVWFASNKVHYTLSDPKIDEQMSNALKITISGVGMKAKSQYSFTTTLKPKTGTTGAALLNSSPMRLLKLKQPQGEELVHPMYYMGNGTGAYGDVSYTTGVTPSMECDTEKTSGGVFDAGTFIDKKPYNRTVSDGDGNQNWNVTPDNRYLPTLADWMTILPVSRSESTQHVAAWSHGNSDFERYKWFDRLEGNDLNLTRTGEYASLRTTQGGAPRFYTAKAYYYAKGMAGGSYQMFALRFVDGGDSDAPVVKVGNRFRSYWRYTYVPSANMLRIDIVHIGEGSVDPVLNQAISIDVLKNNMYTYFQKAEEQGKLVTHYLPFGGHPNRTSPNINGRYLASTTLDGKFCGILFEKNGFFTHYLTDVENAITTKVRYFKVDPSQP